MRQSLKFCQEICGGVIPVPEYIARKDLYEGVELEAIPGMRAVSEIRKSMTHLIAMKTISV